MTTQLLFTRKSSPKRKIDSFIQQHALNLTYNDKKKSIYENDAMMISITNHVLQILLYDGEKPFLKREIKKFFYGDTYEKTKNTRR